MLRARMKSGVRPVVLGGVVLVPEYPTYWEVPADTADGVAQLVAEGQIEYAPEFARNSAPAEPALQVVEVAPAPARADSRPFARKAPRG